MTSTINTTDELTPRSRLAVGSLGVVSVIIEQQQDDAYVHPRLP